MSSGSNGARVRVEVDGIRYVPESSTTPRIGVGIKTRNRHDVLAKTLPIWRERLPAGAVFVLVDDASDKPVDGADYRFEENVGVARASNKALELLYNAGCEHIFLADDDCYPLCDDWWRPYVESPEPHLMAIFDKPKGATKRQVEVLYRDDQHVAYHATRGYFLYVERRVLDRVGGMDPAFGLWGWEHQSWSDRIHAAGLTTARYMDVVGSDKLIYSMDQHGEVKSTVTDEARRFSEGPGLEHRFRFRHSDAYIEFRDLDNVVLTCLLTDLDDPQRKGRMPNQATMLAPLRKSIGYDCRFVVLTTGLDGTLPDTEVVEVPQHTNPYFERWIAYYRWLRDNDSVGFVWCVDGTDVEATRNPFPEMERGKLYMGYEPDTLRSEWMVRNHPDSTLQRFMAENVNATLLNMGVVGGDRATVMEFAQRVTKFYFDDLIDWIYGWETDRVGVGDMAVGNYVARTFFADRLVTGPAVVNVFKSNKPSPNAWWKHK
jgi:hypothetical protein